MTCKRRVSARTLSRVLASSLAILSIVACTAHAANSDSDLLTRVGRWPFGYCLGVDVDGPRSLIFAGSGGAVLILDGTDPSNPQLISDAIRTRGLVEDIFYDAADQDLYLACGEGGLEIWDVDDPSEPTLLSATEVLYVGAETPVGNVDVYGDVAIVECEWGYIHSLDVSDPTNPTQVSFNGSMGNPARDMYVSPDGQVHSSGAQRYLRLKIMPDGSLNTSGQFDFTYGPFAVYGTADVAYVGYEGKLWILDLHDPAFTPWSVTSVGGIRDLVVVDGVAYIINSNGFHVWDVHVHNSPFFVGSFSQNLSFQRVVVADGYAYLAARHNGLRIIEIGDGTSPVEVGSYPVHSATFNADVQGRYAYLAISYDGLYVLDLANIESPDVVGYLETPGETWDIDVVGNLAYIADLSGGLRIIDVSDPTMPVEIGADATYDLCYVVVSGDYAYAAECIVNEPENLRVIDVSDPTNPAPVGYLPTPDIIWQLDVEGDYVYVANFQSGLKIIDVSDPTEPVHAGLYEAPDVHDVQVEGQYAYVASADGFGGLIILDVSDPTNPTLVGQNSDPGLLPFNVSVEGSYAYTASPSVHLITVFDISNLANPVELVQVTPPGDLYDLRAVGAYVYICDGAAGLQIYRNTEVSGVDDPTSTGRTRHLLLQNSPNPFNPNTTIRFEMSRDVADARIEFFDAGGRRVRTLPLGNIPPRASSVSWDGRDDSGRRLPAGVYFYQMVYEGGETGARTAILLR